MTRAELKQALKLAVSGAKLPDYLSTELDQFNGIDLHNRRVFATMEQFASLIRGQVVTMNGGMDVEELAKIERLYKRVDLV